MIGNLAPEPELDGWLQGEACDLEQLRGQVVLVEFFQANCPGCFVHALPEAIRLHELYGGHGLKVIAIATAFEDFERNTRHNVQHLLNTGELQGAPLQQLTTAGYLDDGKLPYDIPFSVAMDRLVENKDPLDDNAIEGFILSQIPDFGGEGWDEARRQAIWQQAASYLRGRTHKAVTFEMYALQGTPSSVVIDRQGRLSHIQFGIPHGVEAAVLAALGE